MLNKVTQKHSNVIKKAADDGDSFSMQKIGLLYEKGYGVQKNLSKSNEYFKKSADLGNSDSMIYLGLKYENGVGFEKDYKKGS